MEVMHNKEQIRRIIIKKSANKTDNLKELFGFNKFENNYSFIKAYLFHNIYL